MPRAEEHLGGRALTRVRFRGRDEHRSERVTASLRHVATWVAACVLALGSTALSAATIRVVATTPDLAALVATVAEGVADVQSIVSPDADAETYEPRPHDVEKLRAARMLVRVGLGYDYWLEALLRRAGNEAVARGTDGYADASTGIPLLEIRGQGLPGDSGHAHGAANPHYWLDPENARIITANIAEHLARIVPSERIRIVGNRERFLNGLNAGMDRWRASLAPFAGTKLIAYHNAWPYFARRFRLDVIAFIEPKAGVTPGAAHLRSLIQQGRESGVRAILQERYEPQDASKFVARALRVPVVTLATTVDAVSANAYLALFEGNVAAVASALRGGAR